MYYEAASALLAEIRTCMGGEVCDYATFVSLGVPPAACNSISAFWELSSRNATDSSDCMTVFDHTLTVVITRCCGEDEEFDPLREDQEASCFLADTELLLNCLTCNAGSVLDSYVNCAPEIGEVRFDAEKEGGCYAAAISISFSAMECC
jgi:hypothetical protein